MKVWLDASFTEKERQKIKVQERGREEPVCRLQVPVAIDRSEFSPRNSLPLLVCVSFIKSALQVEREERRRRKKDKKKAQVYE